MRRRFPVRRLLAVVGLTLAWCALWGEASPANLASGIVVSVAVSGPAIGTGAVGGVRVRPLLRFAALAARDLMASTVSVAREILTPTDWTEEAIIAVSVPTESRAHLLLLTSAITVTPGTAVVDADPDTGTLYLHLLHADRRAATEAHVRELAQLACDALPSAERPSMRSSRP